MKLTSRFFKMPWLIIAVCVIITGALGFFIKDLGIDNSVRQFLPQKDASYTRLEKTEDQFGSMVVIGVSVEAKTGSILTPENIEVIRKISDRCLELDTVSDVDSLTHIDYVCESDGSISASQLIPESYTGSQSDIAQLQSRLTEWSDMYNRVIINDNAQGSQLQITLNPYSIETEIERAQELNKKHIRSEAEFQEETLNEVTKIVKEECKDHRVEYKIFGNPVVVQNARQFMLSDLSRLIPLVIIVVLLSLLFSFKTIDGTLLPLITVVMATTQAMGLMALLKITFTLVSSVIPVALIAVGSAYGIHVLNHYYVSLDLIKGELTRQKYEEAVLSGLKEVMNAVILAGVTTIIGFISLVSSPIDPLHSFAVFTAAGVGISLLLSITFIPAILLTKKLSTVQRELKRRAQTKSKLLKKLKKQIHRHGDKDEDEARGNTLYSIYYFFCGTKPRLTLFIIAIIGFSAIGLSHLKIDTALVNYFPKNCKMRQDIDYVDKNFAGTNSVYFNVTGPEKGSLTNPEILKAVDDMQQSLEAKYPDIGKIVSFTTFIKRINQVWHVPQTEGENNLEVASINNDDDIVGFDDFSFNSDDSFGFTDDELLEFDDFSSFGDFGNEDSTLSTPAFDMTSWKDPNVEYTEKLNQKMTTQDILAMLNAAYIKAGGKNATTSDIIEELSKSFNFNGTAYYEIPTDIAKYPVATKEDLQGVVNGYMILLSGSLGRFVDDDMNPQVMRITCQLRNHSTQTTGDIIADAKKYAEEHFPEGYSLEATGTGEMEYTMTNLIVSSQLSSLLISLICVFVIITIAFKSGWAGLLGAVPLALAIILNYMVMGFSGINLDLVTSIIASVAVGVGIDYTIHFLTTYKEERSKSDDLEVVTKLTFKKSGHGIITNAIAVGLGFLVLTFSKFIVLRYIGVLVAIVMFSSSFLAMTVIPALLNLFEPKFIKPKDNK